MSETNQATITTGNGATITVTATELGAIIQVSEGHVIVYRTMVTDNRRHLRFEVEPVKRKK